MKTSYLSIAILAICTLCAAQDAALLGVIASKRPNTKTIYQSEQRFRLSISEHGSPNTLQFEVSIQKADHSQPDNYYVIKGSNFSSSFLETPEPAYFFMIADPGYAAVQPEGISEATFKFWRGPATLSFDLIGVRVKEQNNVMMLVAPGGNFVDTKIQSHSQEGGNLKLKFSGFMGSSPISGEYTFSLVSGSVLSASFETMPKPGQKIHYSIKRLEP